MLSWASMNRRLPRRLNSANRLAKELDAQVQAFRSSLAAGTNARWLLFLRQLASRGLSGVRLAISDSHLGLK